MSRYMQKFLQINVAEKWVGVEAGVIKDQLKQFLAPYDYFFSPELSTSNRATLGAMINTDAPGQGSLVYGKTSDHVLSVKAILLGGEVLEIYPMTVELAERFSQQQSTIGRIYSNVYHHNRQQRQLILAKFPRLNRFLTGYDLRHVFDDTMTQFDLTRILTVSEGTLAFITKAKLNITLLPKIRRLVNINYDSFDSALRNAPVMVAAKADNAQKWIKIFAQFGRQLINVNIGCCGMAGTYGHEVKHLANSKGIYALSWGNRLQKLPKIRCLATGYACCSQVKRIENETIKHPLQALLEIFK